MKKYDLSSIMKAAWGIFRKGVASFSVALRMAWANAKTHNAAKDAAGITEETHTWYGWKERGYEVRHESKCLYQAVIPKLGICKSWKTISSPNSESMR